ncbi:MAG: SpoIID/LytB domain-containing protein [Chitinispirillaceae bacterium]
MENRTRSLRSPFFAFFIGAVVFCAPILVPNPPAKQKSVTSTPQLQAQPVDTRSGTNAKEIAAKPSLSGDASVIGETLPPSHAVSRLSSSLQSGEIIRIALARSASQAVFYVQDTVTLHSASPGEFQRLSGRIAIAMLENRQVAVRFGDSNEFQASLPCTLMTLCETSSISFGARRYRGSMVLEGTGNYAVLNCLDIEDYLRGVVPLEMGKRSWQELEALKAQAVASRTYAYRRIQRSRGESFDLLSTIADQVYGGADAETAEADSAVRSTRGLVVRWGDSLADIYFHSTCGGYTAGFDEAWNKPPCPYLQSQSDLDPDGKPYCAFSPLFEWEETWSADQLSAIIRKNSVRIKGQEPFAGELRKIRVLDRFPSGRVKACRFEGKGGIMESGGDLLRSILRRNSSSGGLLRSSNFTIVENGPHRFTLHGKGYGHGVGMCQMGAVGRACRGERFDQILKAYFTGTEIAQMDAEWFSGR